MPRIPSVIAQLPLFGPAGLFAGGESIPLRNKSLAILYYLAIEGPVGRAAMAELLWEHASARQNLRVELHHIRRSLERLGIIAFAGRKDLLELPPGIELDTHRRAGEVMEGLEGVSGSFREWLMELRGRSTRVEDPPSWQFSSQAAELAHEIEPPFLLIVRGSPLAGFQSFAMQLARELGMPFLVGVEGAAAGVRYLPMPQTGEQVRRVLQDQRSVWILPTPPFGEDHSTLLELRAQWPPGRTRFVSLRPLSWPAARRGPLKGVAFHRAAQLFLCSAGDAVHLHHLLELHHGGDGPLPLPQQVRAAYQRESRFLSYPARLALERLAVHPDWLEEGLIEAQGAHDHLDELERRGWLAYEGAWRFTSEPARRVLYQALQPGRRNEYHRAAARYYAAAGQPLARRFHERCAGLETGVGIAAATLPLWAQAVVDPAALDLQPVPQDTVPQTSTEVYLEPPDVHGHGWGQYDGRFYFVRNGPPYPDNALVFPGLEEPAVLRLQGRGWVENALDVGMDGNRAPLTIEVSDGTLAVFAAFPNAGRARGRLLLPVSGFDLWLSLPPGVPLRFASLAERAVIEFELHAYRPLEPLPGRPTVIRTGV